MTTHHTCIVGIHTPNGHTVKAFDMRIRGEEVYTNYSDCRTPEAHTSYHKSGQYHMKKGDLTLSGPAAQPEKWSQ